MALTTNNWSEETITDTICFVQNAEACNSGRTLECQEVLLLVLDALSRGGVLDFAAGPPDAGELIEIETNALCALEGRLLSDVDMDKLKSLVLWALNEHIANT